MPLAFAIITVGFIVAVSGFKGITIADVLSGELGDLFDPTGGKSTVMDASATATKPQSEKQESTNPSGLGTSGNKWGFVGPNADGLATAATMAVQGYGLTITSTSGGGHVSNSWHYKKRAFDASGKAADMAAFARWCAAQFPDALEIFYDPIPININDGVARQQPLGGHSDHVHLAL